jgi:hypothetical protein
LCRAFDAAWPRKMNDCLAIGHAEANMFTTTSLSGLRGNCRLRIVNAVPKESLMNCSRLVNGIFGRVALGVAGLVCAVWMGLAVGPAFAAHSDSPLASGAGAVPKQDMVRIAQVGCPPGYNYDYSRHRCRSAHDREYRGPRYRGNRYGRGCPPGYNWGAGGCHPANNYYAPAPHYRPGACPPTYNWNGYTCVRNY